MTPKAKRAEARAMLIAKRDYHAGNGQTATANLYAGRLIRLERGRYDDKLDDVIAGLKIGAVQGQRDRQTRRQLAHDGRVDCGRDRSIRGGKRMKHKVEIEQRAVCTCGWRASLIHTDGNACLREWAAHARKEHPEQYERVGSVG